MPSPSLSIEGHAGTCSCLLLPPCVQRWWLCDRLGLPHAARERYRGSRLKYLRRFGPPAGPALSRCTGGTSLTSAVPGVLSSASSLCV